MRTASAFLERFRRPAAVPAAAGEELDSELSPVLDTLDHIDDEARALRADAELEAGRRVETAAREAEHALERWRRRAESERLRAEREARTAAEGRSRAIEEEAELEAARIRARGLERIPRLVELVLACVEDEEEEE